jgi:NAD-dependent oxidoreductase involved in siderophore biosynthesis
MGFASAVRAGAIVAVAAIVVGGAPGALARSDQAYCAVSRGFDILYEDCSYPSLAACLETIRGLGGHCRPNAYYVPRPPERRYPERGPPRPPR